MGSDGCGETVPPSGVLSGSGCDRDDVSGDMSGLPRASSSARR
jgi:hypothetical protein